MGWVSFDVQEPESGEVVDLCIDLDGFGQHRFTDARWSHEVRAVIEQFYMRFGIKIKITHWRYPPAMP